MIVVSNVLLTSYNLEKYIAEAIESTLVTGCENFELIILNACSNGNIVNKKNCNYG